MSDTIYRQAAIDALDCINGTEEVLRSLPSAQADREEMIVICDNCGHAIHVKKIERREE